MARPMYQEHDFKLTIASKMYIAFPIINFSTGGLENTFKMYYYITGQIYKIMFCIVIYLLNTSKNLHFEDIYERS